ncbi:MAG TPA: SNF2 helicase-associated domain-containing protein, partial [Microthrixaceae bacterium]|nr:SNF2 helicase-associated domain-containing protein [Microthrixaceae bacterium]
MFEPSRHVTLIPGDPWRSTELALWDDSPTHGQPAPASLPGTSDVLFDDSPNDVTSGGIDGHEPEPTRSLLLALPDTSQPAGEQAVTAVAARCRVYGFAEVLDDLVRIPVDHPAASPSVGALALVVRSALALIGRGRLQPRISEGGSDTWVIGPLDESDLRHVAELAAWIPPTIHCGLLDDAESTVTTSTPRIISSEDAVLAIYNSVADALPRTGAAATVSRQTAWAGRDVVDVADLRSFVEGAEASDRTVLRLVVQMPAVAGGAFEVALQVRSAKDPSLVADAAELWAGTAVGFDERAEADMLLMLRRATPLWSPCAVLLEQAEPTSIEVSDEAVMALLGDLANDLRGVGIEVMAPLALMPRVSSSAHVSAPPQVNDSGTTFDLRSVCELTWSATIDGEPLTEAELSLIAQSGRRIMMLRGNWVIVDENVVRRLGRTEQISGTDALAAALSGDVVSGNELVPVSVASP